jgi:hypothetical protein
MESSGVMKYGWFKEQQAYLNENPKSRALMIDANHTIWGTKPNIVCDQLKMLVD